jgi:hypothetical protein
MEIVLVNPTTPEENVEKWKAVIAMIQTARPNSEQALFYSMWTQGLARLVVATENKEVVGLSLFQNRPNIAGNEVDAISVLTTSVRNDVLKAIVAFVKTVVSATGAKDFYLSTIASVDEINKLRTIGFVPSEILWKT